MNIGFGITALNKGLLRNHVDGIGTYTLNLYNELIKSASPVFPCNLDGFVPSASSASLLQTSIHHSPLPLSLYLAASALLPTPVKLSNPGSFTLFHATDHFIPRFRGSYTIATVMDIIPLLHPEWVSGRFRTAKNLILQRSVRWADHIITISEYSKNSICDYFNIPAERVSVTPLGVDQNFSVPVSLEHQAQVRTKYNLPKKFFIFVGTLQPRKNIQRILDAYLSLPHYLTQEYGLVITGKDGWKTESLRENLFKGQKNNIYWLNNVSQEELPVLLHSATALVYPSLFEGFGLPVIEAMAAGLPVITSNTTSIPEVAGDAAILVNPSHTDEIAAAMSTVATSTSVREQLISRGKNQAEKFTWSECARQTIKIYNSIN